MDQTYWGSEPICELLKDIQNLINDTQDVQNLLKDPFQVGNAQAVSVKHQWRRWGAVCGLREMFSHHSAQHNRSCIYHTNVCMME